MGDCTEDGEQRGCLFINTLLRVPASDKDITRQVQLISGKLERAFEKLLSQASQNGELPGRTNPHVLARLLLTNLFGLRVYVKTQPGEAAMREVVDSLLTCLDGD